MVKKGELYICIQDVTMERFGVVETCYKRGKSYISNMDGYIPDDMGRAYNWNNPDLLYSHFRKFEIPNENNTISKDRVNHPAHYTWLKEACGIEVIDITRHMNFNLGNVLKYVLRAGHKEEEGLTSKEKQIEDLKKAVFYLNDEIKKLEK